MHLSINTIDPASRNPDGTYNVQLLLTNHLTPFGNVFIPDISMEDLLAPDKDFAKSLNTPNGVAGAYNSPATDDLKWRNANPGHVRPQNVALFLKRVWVEPTDLLGEYSEYPVLRIMGTVKPAGPWGREFERMIAEREYLHFSVATGYRPTYKGKVYKMTELRTFDLTSQETLATKMHLPYHIPLVPDGFGCPVDK